MIVPTPTQRPEHPFRVDGFDTLVAGLDYAARGVTGLNFFSPRGELETALPYRELRQQAMDLAPAACGQRPRARGSRGDRRRDLARLRPHVLRLPVCRARAGATAFMHQHRRARRLCRAAARHARRGRCAAGHSTRGSAGDAGRGRTGAPTLPRVATAGQMADWPAIDDQPVARSAPTSPATSNIPRAAPASRAACLSRSGRSPPTRARSPCMG